MDGFVPEVFLNCFVTRRPVLIQDEMFESWDDVTLNEPNSARIQCKMTKL